MYTCLLEAPCQLFTWHVLLYLIWKNISPVSCHVTSGIMCENWEWFPQFQKYFVIFHSAFEKYYKFYRNCQENNKLTATAHLEVNLLQCGLTMAAVSPGLYLLYPGLMHGH